MKTNNTQGGPVSTQGGYTLVLALVFMLIFGILTTSLAGVVIFQKRVQFRIETEEKAIQIAEAGLDYYKWFLAHFPDDLQDGTGGPGPYVHDYVDPEATTTGQFSLEVTGETQCGIVHAIEINSTGWSNNDPSLTKEVFGKYARPSVAEYAYILNSNVWAGNDRDITGPYHSNGGVRMDGTNNSLVTSGVTNWLCTSSFGCSPNSTEDGVFGAGPNFALWGFPAPAIDFVGLTVDLVNMRNLAQEQAIYFGELAGDPDEVGYRFDFLADGTVDVYQVTDTDWVWGYHSFSAAWERDYDIIATEVFLQNTTTPANCGLIVAEAKVWVSGIITDKVTLASANVTTPGVDTDLIPTGNITYSAYDGSVGLTAIGEDSVFIPINAPDDMTLNGIFIAQNGNFGRNYYTTTYLPGAWDPFALRNNLTINGTIVSNGRVGTRWTCGGSYCSGYNTRVNTYDRNLATDPPPLTPYVSDDFRFIEWLEVD